jgi:hypothetical protein
VLASDDLEGDEGAIVCSCPRSLTTAHPCGPSGSQVTSTWCRSSRVTRWRRGARRPRPWRWCDAWLGLAEKIGCWTPHETEDLLDVLRPLVGKGAVTRNDAVHLIYWLEEALRGKTSVPADQAIAGRRTLDKIRTERERSEPGPTTD